jgi:hypothetical protein
VVQVGAEQAVLEEYNRPEILKSTTAVFPIKKRALGGAGVFAHRAFRARRLLKSEKRAASGRKEWGAPAFRFTYIRISNASKF